MALGATRNDVLRLVMRDGLFLTGSGVAIGLPMAALVSIGLSKVFVDVAGFDAGVIAIATTMLAAAALVASGIPARRAAACSHTARCDQNEERKKEEGRRKSACGPSDPST